MFDYYWFVGNRYNFVVEFCSYRSLAENGMIGTGCLVKNMDDRETRALAQVSRA